MAVETSDKDLLRENAELKAQLKALRDECEEDRIARKNYLRFLNFLPYPVLVRDEGCVVSFLNPAFTRTFGWTLEELRGTDGKAYIPGHLQNELFLKIKGLPPSKNVIKLATKRLTKSGQILDVVMRVGVDRDADLNTTGMIIVLRDVTMEKRINRNRSAMNRISQVLPRYPALHELLQYVSTEIKELLETEGANVMLLDESQKEFYFLSMVHDDPSTQERVRKIRFPMDELVSGQVVKTGTPMLFNQLPDNPELNRSRDMKIGYKVKNLAVVPLRSKERIIGVITADNKKQGEFDKTDLEMLNTIAATVALSIENAWVSEELKKANEELHSLNKAKDKMISHLSHELKTPVAVLLSSYKVLGRKLRELPRDTWEPTLERMRRNLDRIVGIEEEVFDIVENKSFRHNQVFSLIFEQCKDELETLIAEQTGETKVIRKVRQKLDEIFYTLDHDPQLVYLHRFVEQRISEITPLFGHRDIQLSTRLRSNVRIHMPLDPLEKIVDGLIRNAVENTPDGGRIHILVHDIGKGVEFIVQDHGIGLTQEAQKRIFEGFFTTQSTLKYSSKRPFDFNAGGKGADLLRMRIFSERYGFKISMTSKRCRRLSNESDVCDGNIAECQKRPGPPCDGQTRVSLLFPFSDAGTGPALMG